MKEQRRVTLLGSQTYTNYNELDQALAEGWLVANTCEFHEPVAMAYVGKDTALKSLRGHYGVIFILEREKPETKE